MNEGIVEKVRATGGEVYAITSEPQALADQAHDHWTLCFENVGDPHQEISRTCSERGWLTLYANRGNLAFLQTGADWKVEHPKGYFQPGVLAVRSDHRILYRWRSIPSAANMNGTVARPTASYVWGEIERALASGGEVADASLDDDPIIDQAPPPRLLFFASLIANGWFLGIKSLVYSPGMNTGPSRFGLLLARWLVFFAFWAMALTSLPPLVVVAAFAGWLAWIVSDFRRLFRGFDDKTELVAERRP